MPITWLQALNLVLIVFVWVTFLTDIPAEHFDEQTLSAVVLAVLFSRFPDWSRS